MSRLIVLGGVRAFVVLVVPPFVALAFVLLWFAVFSDHILHGGNLRVTLARETRWYWEHVRCEWVKSWEGPP